jgi:signal transduction histidine kinase
MIGDLLVIARLESGVSRVRPRRTGLAGLVTRLLKAHRARAEQRGVELSSHIDPQLEAVLDPELLERAVENLITNALRFVEKGRHIQVTASAHDAQLVIAVRNDGPAISGPQRQNLFQRFAGGEGRAAHNAGLGLYFCRLVAEGHGGEITLQEDPDWSVSFVIRLPSAVLCKQVA